MLAQVARYEVDPDRCEDAVQAFTDAGDEIGGLPGYSGGYVLIDSEGGSVVTCTFWEDSQAMDASSIRAASMRRRAIDVVGGNVVSVQTYNIVRELGR